MDQEQKPREQLFIRELVRPPRPTRAQIVRTIRTAVVAVVALLGVLVLLHLLGRLLDITLWNLLKVLAVPITVGAAVPLLNWLQKQRDLDVEHQRTQDEALQAYLDQMGKLSLEKGLPLSRGAEEGEVQDKEVQVRALARALTLTVLDRLDGNRKRSVVQFLYESGLIFRPEEQDGPLPGAEQPDGMLSGADLREANLSGLYLYSADLSGANLSGADLSGTRLHYVRLNSADLSEVNLRRANLYKADLTTSYREDKDESVLRQTTLNNADLGGPSCVRPSWSRSI